MAYQHKNQAMGEWVVHSLLFQLANIGSEVIRALKWRAKNREQIANNAFERSLELFDLTIADKKNLGRLKEICRAREAWADFFTGNNEYNSTAEQWEKYFLAFNYVANNKV
ncbi:MAG: hypothetical protein U9Q85_00145 [Patescibacteria group bacterium]|nr:hypothetical protein [Patescibacteria group bacterium]